MHRAAMSFEVGNRKLERLAWHESRLLKEDFFEQRKHISNQFEDSVRSLITDLNGIPKNTDSFGLVHGDINFMNIFQNEGDFPFRPRLNQQLTDRYFIASIVNHRAR